MDKQSFRNMIGPLDEDTPYVMVGVMILVWFMSVILFIFSSPLWMPLWLAGRWLMNDKQDSDAQ